jgi:hypothetical protein
MNIALEKTEECVTDWWVAQCCIFLRIREDELVVTGTTTHFVGAGRVL